MTIKELIVNIPAKWKIIHFDELLNTAGFIAETKQILVTIMYYNSEEWIHLSATGRTGKNSWYIISAITLKEIKEDFLGNRCAYQIYPNKEEYVNIHSTVLHLYARVDGKRITPDFRICGAI